MGEAFSLAEVVAAPWAERILLMLPYWRAIDPLRLCEVNGLKLTGKWLQATAARRSVVATSAGGVEMARASRLYYVDYVSPGAPGTL